MPEIVAAAVAESAMAAAPAVAAETTATAAAAAAAEQAAQQAAAQAAAEQAAQQAAAQQASQAAAQQAAEEAARQQALQQTANQGIQQGAQQSWGAANQATGLGTNPTIDPNTWNTVNQTAGLGQTTGEGAEGFTQVSNPAMEPPAPEAPPVEAPTPQTPTPDNPLYKGAPQGSPEAYKEWMQTQGYNQYAQQASQSGLEKGIATAMKYAKDNPISTGMGLMSLGQYMNKPSMGGGMGLGGKYKSKVDMSHFQPTVAQGTPARQVYNPVTSFAVGGPVEQMSAQNAIGGNMMYPQAGLNTPMYSNPAVQRPMPVNVISQGLDTPVDAYTGEQKFAQGGSTGKSASDMYEQMEKERQQQMIKEFNSSSSGSGIVPRSKTQLLSSPYSAAQAEFAKLAKKSKVPISQMPKTNLGDIDNYMDTPVEEAAKGGIMHGLGGYSDGGRLLKGPGDGVSDSIPAVIGDKQPARLADGEFVVPARIVSELGNGSTEAGARKLYAMMERVQKTRSKSIGKDKVAVNSKADKHLPA